MKQIFKQSSLLISAQILTRIIGFFYTIFLANNLGVSNFGLYSVGLAYFSIISSIADFGFNRFLVREIVKQEEKSWEIIWSVFFLRLTSVSTFFAILAVLLYLFDPNKMRVSVILLASLAVLPQAIALTFDGVFTALRKLQFSAISAIVLSISTVIFGIWLINQGFGVMGAVNAIILGQVVYATILGIILYKSHGFAKTTVTLQVLKKAIFGSLPYGILAILGLLYFRIDTVILSYLKGNFETGIYSVGYRFLEALVFIPNALTLALFPVFTKLHEDDPKKVKKLFFKTVSSMFAAGIVIALGYFFVLPEIINQFLPQYGASIDVIRILSFAIPFMFVHIPAAAVLTSTDKYLKQIIIISLMPLTFNILFNLMLIPQFGIIAASWITVLSDILGLVLILIMVQRNILKNE